MGINTITAKYKIGKWIFAVEGPEFRDPEIPRKFRVEEGEPDFLLTVLVVPNFPIPSGSPDRTEYNTDFFREAEREIRIVRFEKDRVPFIRVEEPSENEEEQVTRVYLKEEYLPYYCWTLILSLLRIPERVVEKGAAFLHCSFVNRGGEAILFTAKKQVGKSTQAALWKKFRDAETANGDRALIFENGGRWFAASTPFAGTSKIAENRMLPLKAVVVLDRAENLRGLKETPLGTPVPEPAGEKPVIEKAPAAMAIRALLNGCTYRPDREKDTETILDMGARLISQVSFFKLYGTMDEASVRVLEEKL